MFKVIEVNEYEFQRCLLSFGNVHHLDDGFFEVVAIVKRGEWN
ncbi:hypothetical protein [Pleionea sp. CnH1-48]|nr:hypothetical protein [Pleionea sp. CnH1-48]